MFSNLMIIKIDVDHYTLPMTGDSCKVCDTRDKEGKRINSVVVDQSVELGHLFILGDRYSKSLGLQYKNQPVQMG